MLQSIIEVADVLKQVQTEWVGIRRTINCWTEPCKWFELIWNVQVLLICDPFCFWRSKLFNYFDVNVLLKFEHGGYRSKELLKQETFNYLTSLEYDPFCWHVLKLVWLVSTQWFLSSFITSRVPHPSLTWDFIFFTAKKNRHNPRNLCSMFSSILGCQKEISSHLLT